MKKLALFLFLAATTSMFTSCGDDDDSIVVDESLVPGIWNLTETRSENGRASATIQGIPLSGDYSVTGNNYAATITFTESTVETEPNTFVGSGGFTLVASVTIPTQEPIEVEQNIPELFGTGEWTVSGNTLTLDVQGETTSYEIISLTDQSMTLKIAIDEEISTEVGTETVTVAVTGEQFFCPK